LKCRRQASSLSKCAVKLKIFMVIFYSKIRLFIQLWMITDIQLIFSFLEVEFDNAFKFIRKRAL
ncbi:hypothetical protein LVK05_03740, partial [Tenacibaculum maritimum]